MKLGEMFKKKNGAAFMPYVCCGDPSDKFTIALVKTLVAAGADAIEFGIPFSDPIADGKTIQAASQRSLASGMTPKKAIGIIAKLRKDGVSVPIIVMTYYNIVFACGIANFLAAIKRAGAEGLIVPDVPLDESEELRKACVKAGIDLVYLITPNCSTVRLRRIARKARGFLYAVSVLGTTGARKKIDRRAVELVSRAKRASKLPICVGFGIATPAHAAAFAQAGADGVIVGSEIANIYSAFIRKGRIDDGGALAKIASYARRMGVACHKVRRNT